MKYYEGAFLVKGVRAVDYDVENTYTDLVIVYLENANGSMRLYMQHGDAPRTGEEVSITLNSYTQSIA